MILELLKLRSMYLKEIASKLNRKPSQIYFRLKRMQENSIVEKRSGYPKFYVLNFKKYDFPNDIVIACPKCNKLMFVASGQQTKVCDKCQSRFWITARREKKAAELMSPAIHSESSHHHNKFMTGC